MKNQIQNPKMVGERFRVRERTQSNWQAVYRCECGKHFAARCDSVNRGKTTSCGCRNYGKVIIGTPNSRHPMYEMWKGMRQRCRDPKNVSFKNYGGKGVKVCSRWQQSFHEFLTDMGERPEGMTLDRIDSNGDYEPDNVRWATYTTQNRNSGNTKLDVRKVGRIKRRLRNGEKGAAIAREYAVAKGTIYAIAHERSWADVAPESENAECC